MSSDSDSPMVAQSSPREPGTADELRLSYGLMFEDLYHRDGLTRLDACFLGDLKDSDVTLHDRLVTARAAPESVAGKVESDLIVDLAPPLEDFIADLFGIKREVCDLQARHHALAPLYSAKRLFVQRRAAKKYGPDVAGTFDGSALRRQIEQHLGAELTELRFAEKLNSWFSAPI